VPIHPHLGYLPVDGLTKKRTPYVHELPRSAAAERALDLGGEPGAGNEQLAEAKGYLGLFAGDVFPVFGNRGPASERRVERAGTEGPVLREEFGYLLRLAPFPSLAESVNQSDILSLQFLPTRRYSHGFPDTRLNSTQSLGRQGCARYPKRKQVVIDTDAGIDDLVALALAVSSPHLDIVAITSTYGNAPLASTTRNARELLRLANRQDIPVHPGCSRPLIRDLVTAPEIHGITGAGYAMVPAPAAADRVPNQRVLLQVLARCPKPVVLVTLGPLTNLACALRQDADLVRMRVAGHIGMFGSPVERGSGQRCADFNAWCDPEAAEQVLRAGIDTLMVGLDVTRRMVVRLDEVQAITSSRDPLVRWLGEALLYYVESTARQGRSDGCSVHDAVAIGELLSPGLLQVADHRLCIDLDDGEHRGQTRRHSTGCMTRVAVEADMNRVRTLLAGLFGSDWPAR